MTEMVDHQRAHPRPTRPVLHRCLRCFHGCCDWRRRRVPSSETGKLPFPSYLRIVAAKFVLEAMGAAGAVWGTSDILLLRETPEGTERMRLAATLVGSVFAVRFWWHAKHWYQHERDYLPIKMNHRRTHRLSFFQIHASKFVLHVMGGAGAIWGCAEALTLRNSTNAMQWRLAALAVGGMFLIRWAFQILAYCLYLAAMWSDPSSVHMTILRWYEALIVKLILEVLGAVGAIWGFSEIVMMRNPETNQIWRPISIGIGIIFTVRWILSLADFVKSERVMPDARHLPQQEEAAHRQEVEDLVIDDLQLKETASSDEASVEIESLEAHTSMGVVDVMVEETMPAPTGPAMSSTPPRVRRGLQID
ncbi:hypothetical protein ACHAWF_009964 [Thalassiosira exigua]